MDVKGLLMVLGAVLVAVGGYAWVQATAEQAADERQAAHCKTVNALVLAEFDAIVGTGKFPTQAQQDGWVRLTANCGDAQGRER